MRIYDNEPLGKGNAGDKKNIVQSYLDLRNFLNPEGIGIKGVGNWKIVVGRKGSGKTHLLRYIHEVNVKNKVTSEYCPMQDNMLSRGAFPYRGEKTFEEEFLFWASMWRIAFNVSALSVFFCRHIQNQDAYEAIGSFVYKKTAQIIDEPKKYFDAYINRNYPAIAWDFDSKQTPLEVMDALTSKFPNSISAQNGLIDTLNHTALEKDVRALLQQYGGVHYLIDGLDEFSLADPRGWSALQVGLFKAIFLMASLSKNSQYLKVTIAIRNYVHSIITSEDPHYDRAKSDVAILNWDKVAAKAFLESCLNKIANGNFADSDKLLADRPFANWLGFDDIKISSRNMNEDVEEYFLRHTRLTPRHIVEAINTICKEKNIARNRNTAFSVNDFKEAISEQAYGHGKAMFKHAAEELRAQLEEIEIEHSKELRKKSTKTQNTTLADRLEEVVAYCGDEVIEMDYLDLVIHDKFFNGSDIKSPEYKAQREIIKNVMWRSAIFAYKKNEEENWKFCWSKGELGLAGPKRRASFVGFHSTLIDVCDLKVKNHGTIF